MNEQAQDGEEDEVEDGREEREREEQGENVIRNEEER